MREDARQRATEFVKELYATGEIDADRFGAGVAGVLAAGSEAELAEVVQSWPAPVTLTSQERRLAEPLEIHSGLGRLRLAGQWQVAWLPARPPSRYAGRGRGGGGLAGFPGPAPTGTAAHATEVRSAHTVSGPLPARRSCGRPGPGRHRHGSSRSGALTRTVRPTR